MSQPELRKGDAGAPVSTGQRSAGRGNKDRGEHGRTLLWKWLGNASDKPLSVSVHSPAAWP